MTPQDEVRALECSHASLLRLVLPMISNGYRCNGCGKKFRITLEPLDLRVKVSPPEGTK